MCEAILCGECRQAEESTRSALAGGAFVYGQREDEARRRFQTYQYYVPEMLVACRAMKAAMKQIRPRLTGCDSPPTARVSVIGLTYQPEELTASLVADILEGDGLHGHGQAACGCTATAFHVIVTVAVRELRMSRKNRTSPLTVRDTSCD